LYRRAYPRLFAYARRRSPHGDAADDAVSDTMTRALVRIDSFAWRGEGFDAWLYGILLERARAGARFVGDGPPDVPAHEPEPLGCVLAREEAVEVRRASLGSVRTSRSCWSCESSAVSAPTRSAG
jgi:DNA-directed RNA polymerase specialized sigma24 family protein